MRKRRAGFSLIELLLVIVVISIISVIIGRILIQSYKGFAITQNTVDADWNSLLMINRFVDDIHRIRSAADIGTIAATQMSMVDVDGSSVTYQLSGSTLLRNGVTIATGVTSFALAYYNAGGVSTAIASSVRYVTISMTVTKGNISSTLSSMAATRGMS